MTLTHETAAELLHLIVTPERQPVYVHCLDGVTATGTLVMCLRKLQRWALPPIVAEYTRFDRRRGDQPWQPEPQHGQKCRPPPWQHPSSAAVCLLRARPAALSSSVLPGRGRSTGHPATASGARASRLPSRRSHRLWSYGPPGAAHPALPQLVQPRDPGRPAALAAATLTHPGCNPNSSRLQPYSSRLQPYIIEAATLYVPRSSRCSPAAFRRGWRCRCNWWRARPEGGWRWTWRAPTAAG